MYLAERLHIATTADTTEIAAPTDDDAIIAAARHDIAHFAPLYERYGPLIYAFCLRRLGNREDAADATTVAFTRAMAAVDRYQTRPERPGSTVRAWLFTIARNVVIDMHRASRHHLSLDHEATTFQIADSRATPEDEAIRATNDAALARLLEQLPPRQREVVEARLAGLSMVEIATALGISVAAAKAHQYRAYRTLRDLLPTNQASEQPR